MAYVIGFITFLDYNLKSSTRNYGIFIIFMDLVLKAFMVSL